MPDVLVAVDAQRLEQSVAEMLAAVEPLGGETAWLAEQVAAVAGAARPIPMTRQVRVPRDEVYDLLDRLRESLAPA